MSIVYQLTSPTDGRFYIGASRLNPCDLQPSGWPRGSSFGGENGIKTRDGCFSRKDWTVSILEVCDGEPWPMERAHLESAGAGTNPQCLNKGTARTGSGSNAKRIADGTHNMLGLRGTIHSYKQLRLPVWFRPYVRDVTGQRFRVTHKLYRRWCRRRGALVWYWSRVRKPYMV